MKRAIRFNLRTMLLAVTLWCVALVGFIRLGLVEVLDIALLAASPFVLLAHLQAQRAGRRLWVAVLSLLHVVGTVALVITALWLGRHCDGWLVGGTWAAAWALMFPLALVHHAVCRLCGWHSGLAQPGTFSMVVVLNNLLWFQVWQSWRRRRSRTGA